MKKLITLNFRIDRINALINKLEVRISKQFDTVQDNYHNAGFDTAMMMDNTHLYSSKILNSRLTQLQLALQEAQRERITIQKDGYPNFFKQRAVLRRTLRQKGYAAVLSSIENYSIPELEQMI